MLFPIDIRLEMKDKLPPAASAGFPYDYQSVMHYPWLQIKNGKTNIMYPIWVRNLSRSLFLTVYVLNREQVYHKVYLFCLSLKS